MEEKKSGIRLRLNLFDALVLIAALAVGGFLAWKTLKPAPRRWRPPRPPWCCIPSGSRR